MALIKQDSGIFFSQSTNTIKSKQIKTPEVLRDQILKIRENTDGR